MRINLFCSLNKIFSRSIEEQEDNDSLKAGNPVNSSINTENTFDDTLLKSEFFNSNDANEKSRI